MKTIEFSINYKLNPQIHQDGYVEIPENEDEEPNWYYYDSNGFITTTETTIHDGIRIEGATYEQETELDRFYTITHFDLVDWVDGLILESSEDEDEFWVKGDLIVKINDGAKVSWDYFETDKGAYVIDVRPLYNGYPMGNEFISYMEENGIVLDPYMLEEDTSCVENGHIFFEISKGFFDPKEEEIEKNQQVVENDLQIIFQGYLFSKILKTGFENDIFEQSLDSDLLEQNELFDLYCWANGKMTAEQFADRNGYEWGDSYDD